MNQIEKELINCVNLGVKALEDNNYQMACSTAQEGRRIFELLGDTKAEPDSISAYIHIRNIECEAYSKLNKHTEAIQIGEESVNMYPDDWESYYTLGRAYARAMCIDSAKNSLEKALKLVPKILRSKVKTSLRGVIAHLNATREKNDLLFTDPAHKEENNRSVSRDGTENQDPTSVAYKGRSISPREWLSWRVGGVRHAMATQLSESITNRLLSDQELFELELLGESNSNNGEENMNLSRFAVLTNKIQKYSGFILACIAFFVVLLLHVLLERDRLWEVYLSGTTNLTLFEIIATPEYDSKQVIVLGFFPLTVFTSAVVGGTVSFCVVDFRDRKNIEAKRQRILARRMRYLSGTSPQRCSRDSSSEANMSPCPKRP